MNYTQFKNCEWTWKTIAAKHHRFPFVIHGKWINSVRWNNALTYVLMDDNIMMTMMIHFRLLKRRRTTDNHKRFAAQYRHIQQRNIFIWYHSLRLKIDALNRCAIYCINNAQCQIGAILQTVRANRIECHWYAIERFTKINSCFCSVSSFLLKWFQFIAILVNWFDFLIAQITFHAYRTHLHPQVRIYLSDEWN